MYDETQPFQGHVVESEWADVANELGQTGESMLHSKSKFEIQS